MKSQLHYYHFWLVSNRGTDRATIQCYAEPLTKEKAEDALETWCKLFSAWDVSDCHYGWRKLTKAELPKNRRECLKRFLIADERLTKAKKIQRHYAHLLGVYPYNGATSRGSTVKEKQAQHPFKAETLKQMCDVCGCSWDNMIHRKVRQPKASV
jgi:hypothetical protein